MQQFHMLATDSIQNHEQYQLKFIINNLLVFC